MIDDLDRNIIAGLTADARVKSTALAKKLGVSDTTIRHRIQRLEEEGVIKPTISVDASKMGYAVVLLIALQVDLGSIDVVAKELSAHPNVGYVAECTGLQDMFVGVWLHSPNELPHFVKEFLSKLPGIRKSETYMILNVHKNDISWLQSTG